MNGAGRFDVLIREWLADEAPRSMPVGLHDEAMAEASYLPQLRPWQVALRRASSGSWGRTTWRLAYVAVVVALLLALLAALVAGARLTPPSTHDPSNGAISYTVGRDAGPGGAIGDSALTSVHLADSTTDRVVRLDGQPSSCAAFSTDGKQLAFWSGDGHGGQQLVVGSASGGGLRPIGETNVDSNFPPESEPAWSPDGRYVAYVPWDSVDGGSEVAIVDLPGGTVSLLRPDLGRIESPRWSPDGRRLAYVAGARDVVVSDVSGDNQSVIVRADEMVLRAWSPDGEWLLFEARGAGGTTPDLFAIRPDGTGQRRLTADVGSNRFGVWSPDSTQVAYVTGDAFAVAEGYRLEVVGVDSGTRRAIAKSPDGYGTLWSVVWSPDGRRLGVLAFPQDGYTQLANGDGEVVTMSIDDPTDRLLVVPRRQQLFGICGLSWQRIDN